MLKNIHELLKIVMPPFSILSFSTVWNAYALGHHEGIKDCKKFIFDFLNTLEQDDELDSFKVVLENIFKKIEKGE